MHYQNPKIPKKKKKAKKYLAKLNKKLEHYLKAK